MAFHLFLFLLVVCLCSLALLWRLGWHHLQPSHSQAGSRRTQLHRLLKPRSPLDCPSCRLSCTPSPAVGPASVPIRPWSEVKSRRGAPKRVETEGFACPNQQCAYCGITDAHIHAAFRRWQAWPGRAHPDLSLSGLPYHLQCSAQHTPISPENPFSSRRHGTLCTRRRTGCFRRRARLRLSTGHHHDLAVAGSPCMLRPCTSASSAISGFHTSNWMNCAPGYVAPTRFFGCGWPSIPSPRFCRCSLWVLAHNMRRTCSSTPCDRSWPLAAFRSSPVMG